MSLLIGRRVEDYYIRVYEEGSVFVRMVALQSPQYDDNGGNSRLECKNAYSGFTMQNGYKILTCRINLL